VFHDDQSPDVYDIQGCGVVSRTRARLGTPWLLDCGDSRCLHVGADRNAMGDSTVRYPIMYVMRRGAVVLFYMSGLPKRTGYPAGTIPFVNIDWRIACVTLLSLSTVLLFLAEPWRLDDNNRMEMFSLQFLCTCRPLQTCISQDLWFMRKH
jgi:hypothetical protein